MSGLDALTTAIAVPAWALGVAAALLIVLFAVAFSRSGGFGPVVRLCAILAVGLLVWAVLEGFSAHDRIAERHALDTRLTALTGRAMVPGSPLNCLDSLAGETVEGACEKSLFAAPETVAAAVSYVSAGLVLLADGTEFAKRADASYEKSLVALRRSMESDRFGIVAHVLSMRDKCTVEKCDAFGLLHDPSRVKANLEAETFEHTVVRHAGAWPNSRPAASVATAGGLPSPGPEVTAATAPSERTASHYDFPSADSIPPISIMNAEPDTPPANEPAAPPAAASSQKPTHVPTPPRKRTSAKTTQHRGGPIPLSPPAADTARSQSTPTAPPAQ